MLAKELGNSRHVTNIDDAISHLFWTHIIAVVIRNTVRVSAKPACYRRDVRDVGVAISIKVRRPGVPQSFVFVRDAARRRRRANMEFVAIAPAVPVGIGWCFLREGELYAQHKERAAEHTE